jgi:hypothetical protein
MQVDRGEMETAFVRVKEKSQQLLELITNYPKGSLDTKLFNKNSKLFERTGKWRNYGAVSFNPSTLGNSTKTDLD